MISLESIIQGGCLVMSEANRLRREASCSLERQQHMAKERAATGSARTLQFVKSVSFHRG